jgi:hypothetical protein
MILKDYNELKKQFNATVQILLDRDNKTEISQLERKVPVTYLSNLIEKLDKRLSRSGQPPKKEALDAAASVLYGAMSLVTAEIKASLDNRIDKRLSLNTITLGFINKPRSALRDGLNEAMGIIKTQIKTQIPTNAQYYDIYKKLNHFTKYMFVDKDSRKGIKPGFTAEYIEMMTAYMTQSYEQEARYHRKAITDFASVNPKKTKSTKPEAMDTATIRNNALKVAKTYKAEKGLLDFSESLPQWDVLTSQLATLIHDESTAKNVASPSYLPNSERGAQLLFLQAITNILTPTTEIEDAEKSAILSGAMYLVREQIGVSQYNKELLSCDDTTSLVHSRLSELLNASSNSVQYIESLVLAANHFIMHMTTESEGIRSHHMFSSISKCSIPDILEFAQGIIKTCRCQALDKAVSDFKESLTGTEKAAAVNSEKPAVSEVGFFNKMAKPAEKTTEPELTVEKPGDATATLK